MKEALIVVLAAAMLCVLATDASVKPNGNAKIALHYAGGHNAEVNTCDFAMSDCRTFPMGNAVVDGVSNQRCDIYIIAIDVEGIASVRYGISCGMLVWYYGWTSCSEFENPTWEWLRCRYWGGGGNFQSWSDEQSGPNVVLGIMDVYVDSWLPGVSICACADPRVGYAEFCDGSSPTPQCSQVINPSLQYGCVGFDEQPGFNPCGIVPIGETSWGGVKAIYR